MDSKLTDYALEKILEGKFPKGYMAADFKIRVLSITQSHATFEFSLVEQGTGGKTLVVFNEGVVLSQGDSAICQTGSGEPITKWPIRIEEARESNLLSPETLAKLRHGPLEKPSREQHLQEHLQDMKGVLQRFGDQKAGQAHKQALKEYDRVQDIIERTQYMETTEETSLDGE